VVSATEPPDPNTFLATLKARDATVDNVHLAYDRYGEEVKSGQVAGPPKSMNSLPTLPPKLMKYYYRMEVIRRGQDVTQVRTVDEARTEVAKGYPVAGRYHKWSNKGGVCRELSDTGHGNQGSKTLDVEHNPALSSVILEQLLQVEFALGYGFGKRLQGVSTLTASPTGWTLTGPFKIWGNDVGTCTIDLDKDLVVRKALVDTVSKSSVLWRFEIETSGSVRTDRITFAHSGHFKQTYLGRQGREQVPSEKRVQDDFRVTFVKGTFDLSDAVYESLTDLSPQPNSILVDKDTGNTYAIDKEGKRKLLGYSEEPPPPQRGSNITIIVIVHFVLFTVLAYNYYRRRRRATPL
jgi:hypothetical protein